MYKTLLRLFVGSSIQGQQFRTWLGFCLPSANDYATFKHNIGMADLEWFKHLWGFMRRRDRDLHKLTIKNVLVIISKSNLLYKAATHLPVMSTRDLVWSSLYIQRGLLLSCASSVVLADACCQWGVLQQLLLQECCLRSTPETAMRLSPSLNVFPASQQGIISSGNSEFLGLEHAHGTSQ